MRFNLVKGSESQFLLELCGEQFLGVATRINPFRNLKLEWWLRYWWSPPQEMETYVGGECSQGTMYQILIDTTNTETSTTYVRVSL
jgi:hypothetical protein